MLAPDLADARESLSYWEDRSRRLPVTAVRKRREARDMADRWRARVAEAERAQYGAGLLGLLLLLVSEGRLPERARHGTRHLARRGIQAATVVMAACVALVVLGLVAALEVVVAVADALL